MAKKAVKPTQVIVMWSNRNCIKQGIVNTLECYNGTRVYEKDKVDRRLLLDAPANVTLPYFDHINDAVEFMTENPDKPIQFELGAAKRHKLFT